MAKARKISTPVDSKPMIPALSEEAREKQLCSLAYDLVEQRLRDGTASSQETTHFLKISNQAKKAKLELDILEEEKKLIEAKTDNLKSQKRTEELLEKAMKAFASYTPYNGDNDERPY